MTTLLLAMALLQPQAERETLLVPHDKELTVDQQKILAGLKAKETYIGSLNEKAVGEGRISVPLPGRLRANYDDCKWATKNDITSVRCGDSKSVLAIRNGTCYGVLYHGGGVYAVRGLGGGVNVVFRVNQVVFQPD